MSKALILIVEDDPDIQEMLALAFAPEGWKLLMAKSGEEGMSFLKKELPLCILLDIMLPGMDGLKLLKKIKTGAETRHIPVIMTTAKGEDADIIAGLELGADDYVVKPYSPKVLIARIRTALRRAEEPALGERSFWQAGKLSLDADKFQARYDGKDLELSATEFALLQHFIANPEQVFSRNKIIAAVHGSDYPVTDRSVDVQILALRKKLGDAGDLIETVRGVGYRFRSFSGGGLE